MLFEDSLDRIEDILDAVTETQRHTYGLTFESFEADDQTVDAVVRNFIIIGEAANHVSAELMDRYPAMPWHQMRGLRNIALSRRPFSPSPPGPC